MCRMFKSILAGLAGLAAAAVSMARNEKLNPLKNMGRILESTASGTAPEYQGLAAFLLRSLAALLIS